MIDVTRLEVGMGIVKHKCATFAEAEMLALGGARDVCLAYNVVGPNIDRAVRYRQRFPDVRFSVAADHPEPVDALNGAMARAGEHILTRVVSRPSRDLVTFDLGHKACASDPPAGSRLHFPAIPDAKEVLQNEEHLVIETARASCYRHGNVELAIPTHICPTSALHSHAWVVSDGRVQKRWEVTARDRALTL